MALAAARVVHEGLNLLRFVPGYQTHIVATGKEPLILLLLSFLITFALTRLYTRLARLYGWGSGSVHGVHLHHMVIGIILALVSGTIVIAVTPGSPAIELLAIGFGAGAALTLDEFALWLYFKDVYWSEQGRSSIDATIMAVMFAGLLLVGISPFGLEQAEGELPRTVAFAAVGFNALLALITFLKGRLIVGLLSIFVPLAGLVAAVRLGKPGSPWAHWFYGRSQEKLARSHARFDARDRKLTHVKDRLYDVIGGAPTDERTPERQPELDVVDGYLSVRRAGDAGSSANVGTSSSDTL
ncbi:MAG: hypothetical protein M3292_03820 [Actinomycetota bacterium]|nr:hypothetical protein [Actinomycetota bacterium]